MNGAVESANAGMVSTSLGVTAISPAVGYNSLGSISNRSTERVGAQSARLARYHLAHVPPVELFIGAAADTTARILLLVSAAGAVMGVIGSGRQRP